MNNKAPVDFNTLRRAFGTDLLGPYKLPPLIIALSVVLFYSENLELQLWSPALVLSFAVSVLTGRLVLLVVRPLVLCAFLAVTLVVAINANLTNLELWRFLFVAAGIATASLIIVRGCNVHATLRWTIFLFVIELSLRLFAGNWMEINVYSVKGSGGFFADSNFTAILLFTLTCACLQVATLKRYLFLLVPLLFLTFSRTAWLMLLFYVLAEKWPRAAIALIVLAVIGYAYVPDLGNVYTLDGSLVSKALIFTSFYHLLTSDPLSLLLGLGRSGAIEAAESLTGTSYSGHTLPGQIVQYGLIITLAFFSVFSWFVAKIISKPFAFLGAIVFGGILGLFPSSYFGLVTIMLAVPLSHQLRVRRDDLSALTTRSSRPGNVPQRVER